MSLHGMRHKNIINIINFSSEILYLYVLWFQEIDIGLAADLGTLQRFPKIVGNDSLVRELVYTARKMESQEAKEIGFVRFGIRFYLLNN